MREDIKPLYEEAMRARHLYNIGSISREEAKRKVQPYIDKVNEVGPEIAKKYGGKFSKLSFIGFVR